MPPTRRLFATGLVLAATLGAAPATPSYIAVTKAIDAARAPWTRPGVSQPNAPGWDAFFTTLTGELHNYAEADAPEARLASLTRLEALASALEAVAWAPGAEVSKSLRAWLAPRRTLAQAEGGLLAAAKATAAATDPGQKSNGEGWARFVETDLAASLKAYEGADTVAARAEGLRRLTGALRSLQASNKSRPWAPAVALQSALDAQYERPNLDLTADANTLSSILAANLVTTGPIFRKGYWSYVTAGPYAGFQLLPSDDGIAFANSQYLSSVTPVTDFEQQIESDKKGRKAAKLYQFAMTTADSGLLSITAVISPVYGLQLFPSNTHNVSANVGSSPTPGGGFGRAVANLVGMNQGKINAKVQQQAYPQVAQGVVTGSAEESQERTSAEAAQRNVQIRKFLPGDRTLTAQNIIVHDLSMRSRPDQALVGGLVGWRGVTAFDGADFAQPPSLAAPEAGVTVDVHLNSLLTNLAIGYFQSDPVKDVNNVMVVTRKVQPGAPPASAAGVSVNADYPAFLAEVKSAREANDPKILAIRVKKPTRSPEFAADSAGNLVVEIYDFRIEVPAPPNAARGGGLTGPAAQVYRIESPRAELVINLQVAPKAQDRPIRLSGKVVAFDPGVQARMSALNEDETPAPLNAFIQNVALNVVKSRVVGQPIDVPLSDLKFRGFDLTSVSPLDPSGWLRVVLTRTTEPIAPEAPAAASAAPSPAGSATR